MKKPALGFKRFKLLLKNKRPQLPVSTAVFITSLGLLGFKLTSLVPYGPTEYAQKIGSATLSAVERDSLYAPIKILQLFILKVTEHDAYIRLAPVVAAAAATWLLYLMLRKWHTQRISLLTTAMFATSTYFLQIGRNANLEVAHLWVIPAILLICMWLLSKKNNAKLPIAALLLALVLYIPGAWLFAVAGALFLRKIVVKTVRQVSRKLQVISTSVLVLGLAPLLYSFVQRPQQAIVWLGVNTDQLSLSAITSNIVAIPKELFVYGPQNPATWLVGTPILDIFSIAMVVVGVYAYHAGYYPAREKLVLGSVIGALALIGVGGIAPLALLLPILYIIIANGLSYMLQSWFTVFPKNPVARPLGIIVLTAAITVSCVFQLQRYFVAWPQADTTRQALTEQR